MLTQLNSIDSQMRIPIDRCTNPRLDAEAVANLKLSNVPSDHVFIAEYAHNEWRKERIGPYRALQLTPLTLGLHYAQQVFEGMKAYIMNDGRIGVFRTDRHAQRFNVSLRRMAMPEVPPEMFANAIHTLVDLDRQWVPPGPDSAYYIRPFVIATEERIGLKPSEEFMFLVGGGPFRPVYPKPLRVRVERTYTRASKGGTGYAKCGGNYAAAMLPTILANEAGYDQVLWTDAEHHEHIEESGTMNVMFIINDVLTTAPLGDTILDGVTRDSILTLARERGIAVDERAVSVTEFKDRLADGSLTEAFGVGTAASVSPIATVGIDGVDYNLEIHPDATMFTFKKQLLDIRTGAVPDRHNWMTIIDGYAK
jgi:branched-chain amino acid aminotransferase